MYNGINREKLENVILTASKDFISRESNGMRGLFEKKINESFFNNWNHESAYILGFLYAEGSVSKHSIAIILSTTDAEILYKINKSMDSNYKVGNYISRKNKDYRYSKLSISNYIIKKRLCEIGLKDKIFPSDISVEFIGDFIRGYFDGDGCICVNKSNSAIISFADSKRELLFELRRVLSFFGLSDGYIKKRRNCWYLNYWRNADVYFIFNVMYDNIDNSLYYKRKYDIFVSYLSRKGFINET